MVRIDGVAGLRRRKGLELGISGWHELSQQEIDDFAELTGDSQWIHVDGERAAAGPFGSTIAHGLLTLSLGPLFSAQIYEIADVALALNYGYARVRFPAPLPVGSRVRMRALLASVDEAPGGVQISIEQTFERDGTEKPVCVAELLIRVLGEG